MASPDLAHVLAELAAIQHDVKVLAECHIILMPGTNEWCKALVARIGLLMASITAPPPAESARDDGGRCHHCGHYEISYARASEQHAHCPSCSRHTRWIRVSPPGVLTVDPAAETMVSQLMAANTPAATTSRKLEPIDNGMLAAVNARLAAVERRLEGHEVCLHDHDVRIVKAQRKADGHG